MSSKSSKWTRVKELGQRGLEQARAAEAKVRAHREAAEAAKAAAAAEAAKAAAAAAAETMEQAEVARAQREEARAARIAKAAGPNGVISGTSATWDGRVLRVSGGTCVMPNGRKKMVFATVAIPLQRIASASFAGRVHVCVMDGREYQFISPKVMAEAIEAALVNQ